MADNEELRRRDPAVAEQVALDAGQLPGPPATAATDGEAHEVEITDAVSGQDP